MNKNVVRVFIAVCTLVAVSTAAAVDLEDISNFRQYSPQFASSGQPSAEQLKLVQEAGFQRVIYLAFTNDHTAIDDEDAVVKELGMDYIHIPIDWENPTSDDFNAFIGVMQVDSSQKTLLHCQVNFRASSFSFLYRVIYEGVGVADAKEDLDSVWKPNSTWRNLIFEILRDNDISPECDVCDWES